MFFNTALSEVKKDRVATYDDKGELAEGFLINQMFHFVFKNPKKWARRNAAFPVGGFTINRFFL